MSERLRARGRAHAGGDVSDQVLVKAWITNISITGADFHQSSV